MNSNAINLENIVLTQDQSINTSQKYKQIRSDELLTALTARGFELNTLQVQKVRDKAQVGYQKHVMRLRHPELTRDARSNIPELVIINSHNGTTSLQMLLGIYRIACANGLIVGNTFGGHIIRHVGDVETRIQSALDSLMSQVDKLVQDVNKLESRPYTEAEASEFIKRALQLRLGEDALKYDAEFKVFRSEDRIQNAWTLFNVVQEGMMRKGFIIKNRETSDLRWARVIKSIPRQVELNRELWDLTQEIFQ